VPAVVGRDSRTAHVGIGIQQAKRLAEVGERQRLPALECGEYWLHPVEVGQSGGRARPPRRPNGDRALGRRVQVCDTVDELAIQPGQLQRSVGPPDPFIGQPAAPAARLGGPGWPPGRPAPWPRVPGVCPPLAPAEWEAMAVCGRGRASRPHTGWSHG